MPCAFINANRVKLTPEVAVCTLKLFEIRQKTNREKKKPTPSCPTSGELFETSPGCDRLFSSTFEASRSSSQTSLMSHGGPRKGRDFTSVTNGKSCVCPVFISHCVLVLVVRFLPSSVVVSAELHCSATMMYSGSSVLQPPESGMGGNKRIPCPLHGCKRVYTDPAALESHIKDHEIAAQSLPGKVMLCSTVGCSGSFPNMQKLIEHMRHHHKPNIFFVCESCRTKLRSYRGLLTHLHTCSKVMRGKAKPTEPNMAPMEVDQKPPWLEAASAPSQILNPDPSFPAAVKPGPDGPPLLGPPFMSNLEPAPPHPAPPKLTEAAPQPPIRSDASDLTPSLHFGAPPLTPTQGQHPTQTRSPEDVHPAPASAPRSPPGPSAVWRKNQGSCSSRILWEHTKGRYTCVQCGHMAISRKEMTQHISTKHSRNKAAEDTGSAATNT